MSSSDSARQARQISPAGYIWVSRFALILLCVIVVSGAAVRLSGSGLGCSDWPRCNSEKFIDVSTTHGAIEQVNRLFTGLVTAIVIAAVLAARFRVPYRKDLVMLSWGLVAGVIGQIVLGGIVVLTDLHPLANQGHFVLSMILVANALVLHQRAKNDRKVDRLSTLSGLQKIVRLTVAMASLALITGTVVTGSGPHAGDATSQRVRAQAGSFLQDWDRKRRLCEKYQPVARSPCTVGRCRKPGRQPYLESSKLEQRN
jgi:cytochrome c oxidase assembly protein subunit 15